MKIVTENSVGLEFKKTANKIYRYIENHSAKKRIDELTGTNAWIIEYLATHEDDNIYQKDIERKFGITRSTASKTINLMVKKGFIVRESVEHDARLKKLVLTKKAEIIAEMMENDTIEAEKVICKNFTQAEIKQLIDYLKRIQDNL